MPPTKVAKNVAKKAARKSPGHDTHRAPKDTRRAYEHLGRVQSLLGLQDPAARDQVQQLTALAQRALQAGQPREAADLLRAAEHLAFGSLRLADLPDETIAEDLVAAIDDEIEHHRAKAKEHGEAATSAAEVTSLYRFMADSASQALASKRYRAALEFSRGAEALTHLDARPLPALAPGTAAKRLDR